MQQKVIGPSRLPLAAEASAFILGLTDGSVGHKARPLSASTRNGYHSALSCFADWLVGRGVLTDNPMRRVKRIPSKPPRTNFYSLEEAEAVLAAHVQPFAALEAFMCLAGMEWQSVQRLRVGDVDLKDRTVRCRGSKQPWRNRTVMLVEEVFPFAMQYIAPVLRGPSPDELIFAGIRKDQALDQHRIALERAGVKDSTLHDWRHTHAVQLLRAGYPESYVAHQLGHKDTALVRSTYGRFVPKQTDFHEIREAISYLRRQRTAMRTE